MYSCAVCSHSINHPHIHIQLSNTQPWKMKFTQTLSPNYNKGYQLQAPYFPKFPMGLVSLMDQGASISRSHPLPLY